MRWIVRGSWAPHAAPNAHFRRYCWPSSSLSFVSTMSGEEGGKDERRMGVELNRRAIAFATHVRNGSSLRGPKSATNHPSRVCLTLTELSMGLNVIDRRFWEVLEVTRCREPSRHSLINTPELSQNTLT